MDIIDRQKAIDLIKAAKNVLITPSSPADGDSIGSALALMTVLRKLGKTVTVATPDPIPDVLKFLPFLDQINFEIPQGRDFVISLNTENADVDHMKYEVDGNRINVIITPKNGQFTPHDVTFVKAGANFDLIITVDTGDIVQIGKIYENNKDLFDSTPVLNIDHHFSNGKFGNYNFLDFTVASTTQMLTLVIQQLEKDYNESLIDEDVATLLLTGLVTDTGSFQHSNTTPDAFEVAADLLDRGARQQEIIKHIFKTKSLATLKLWGRVLSKIQYVEDAKLVYSTITDKDLADTGAKSDDTGGIIDELMSNAPGAEVVMLIKEKAPGLLSGSLRAPGTIADVSVIAQTLGGGGHKKAAGFRIKDKSFEEGLQIAIDTIRQYIQGKEGKTVPKEIVHESKQVLEASSGKLFPNLVVKPQTSIPKPSEGGEDLLLQDFRKRQSPDEERVKESSVKFFQDADGQVTVGDVLSQLSKD